MTWKPQPGQVIPDAVIAVLPSPSTGGRLLLKLPLTSESAGAASRKRGGPKDGADATEGQGGGGGGQRATVGTVVTGLVTAVHATHMDVKVGWGSRMELFASVLAVALSPVMCLSTCHVHVI